MAQIKEILSTDSEPPPSGGPAILLVEDDPDDSFLIGRAFRKAGLSAPFEVRDGEAAVAYLKGEGEYADRERCPLPELMLLDLKLPRLSGLEVLQWVREQKSSVNSLPVVVLTSSAQHPDIERAYVLCVNAYLVKPVDPAALEETVRRLGLFWSLNRTPAAWHKL